MKKKASEIKPGDMVKQIGGIGHGHYKKVVYTAYDPVWKRIYINLCETGFSVNADQLIEVQEEETHEIPVPMQT